MSMHLIALTTFSRKPLLTFQSFSLKIIWIFFPILPKKPAENRDSLIYCIMLMFIKIFINHWIYRWSIQCDMGLTLSKIFMLYLSIMTISYIFDAQMIIVRIATQDKYTLESYTDSPILSLSLGEFWGQRYNRIVHKVLREAIFEPIRSELSSSNIAGFMTFIVSGLLHVHVCIAVFQNTSSAFPTFMFFIIHGIGCCLEKIMKIKFPKFIRWIITHIFILITSPLMFQPFIEKGSPFLMLNPPLFIDVEWTPKLPVPNFCPQ
ncbi:unnamed protein product [Rotaria socialis]|uniref:Wax synthase domain-containing protein n=1 Tax=Rotaria socialis TaxID=392032 RepID=A0A818EGV3_9BILA|nr:unnamed protein product [Rotaria socialis]